MSDLGKSRHGIPDVVMIQIDKYVDSLAPQIQPRIATEIDEFQTKTIDSLEDMVVDAFRSLFNRNGRGEGGGSRSLDDSPPDSYGVGSLPFANEIVSFTQSFSRVADEASDDLREIFNITEGGGGGDDDNNQERSRGGRGDGGDLFSQGARGLLSVALDVVKDRHRNSPGSGRQQISFDGLLGVLSNALKETSRNPEGKARAISPEIKEKVAVILRRQHAPIAEQFTRIALDHIKRWLRGNTSTRDLGDGMKGEIKELVSGIAGMFGSRRSGNEGERSREVGDNDRDGNGEGGGGFSGVISDKLSTGLAKVHREVRLEFRNVLGVIEKKLFEALPDEVQGPLEKILGGNPFDTSLDAQTASRGETTSRGFGDDIKAKLVSKIRDLVRKMQDSLRQSVLSVVNGGHRKFERASWMFVHQNVEAKVQRFLPDVRIRVPDDIGNEGVSVGATQTQMGPGPSSGSSGYGDGQHQQPASYTQYSPRPPPDNQYRPPEQEHYPPPDQYRPQQHYQHHSQYMPPEQHYQPHDKYQPYNRPSSKLQ